MSMSGVLKGVFIFAAGAGIGVLGTARHFMKKAEKACQEYEDRCSAEYEELRASLIAKEEYSSDSLENSREENPVETLKAHDIRKKVDYTVYSRPNISDIMMRAEEINAEEESPMEDNAKRPGKLRGPRIIKNEEFGNDRRFESVYLYYFTGDGVLATEDKEEIEPDKAGLMLGDTLSKYDFPNNDQETMSVRDEANGIDYQIEKIIGHYRTG